MEVYPRPTFKANIAKFLGITSPIVGTVSSDDELAAEALLSLASGK
jgi:hypothetical protein